MTSLPAAEDEPIADLNAELSADDASVIYGLRHQAVVARRVRGFSAVILVLMLSAQAADEIPGATLPPLPLGLVLAGLLLFVNFVDPTRDPQVPERVARQRRIVEMVLDSSIVFIAILLVGLNPASPLWALLLFPLTQAALRFDLNGMAVCFAGILLAYAAGEFWAAGRYQEVPFGAATVLQQIGVLLVLACTAANHRHISSMFALLLYKSGLETDRSERRRDPGEGFAVVYVDIADNGFLPEQVKVESLREIVAKRISGSVRAEDQVLTSDANAFVVILEGLHELIDASVVGERILKRLQKPFAISGQSVDVDPRVSVAYAPNGSNKPDDLIEIAGREAFRARRNGDETLVICGPGDQLASAAV